MKKHKVKVSMEIDVPTGKASSIIKQMQDLIDMYGDVEIEEKWSGYEDNYFEATYYRDETPEELEDRLENEKYEREKAEIEKTRRKEEAELEKKNPN